MDLALAKGELGTSKVRSSHKPTASTTTSGSRFEVIRLLLMAAMLGLFTPGSSLRSVLINVYALRTMKLSLAALVLCSSCSVLLSCGSQPDCSTVSVLRVGPTNAAADHMAKAPDNAVQFTAFVGQSLVHPQNACGVPTIAAAVKPTWTVSDPTNVTISSAEDATNGLATCVGATTNPVTVTGTTRGSSGAITATATISCH